MEQITSLEQVRQLMLVQDAKSVNKAQQFNISSFELDKHSLTLDDLLNRGVSIRDDSTPTGWRHITIKDNDFLEFRFKLTKLIAELQKQIEFMMTSSRRVFGNLNGHSICFLVDCSEANFYGDRKMLLKEAFKLLVEEQLLNKTKVQLISFSSDAQTIWNKPMMLAEMKKHEVFDWIDNLVSGTGCNLLEALKLSAKQQDVETVCIILGSRPDQDPDILINYMKEKSVGQSRIYHTVDLDSKSYEAKMLMKELSDIDDGKYQSFTEDKNHDMMNSTDTCLLSQELKRALIVLSQLDEISSGGIVKNTIVNIKKNPSEAFKQAQRKEDKERELLRHQYEQLKIHHSAVESRSSKEWLKKQGLKAKGLTLYQVMAPNAYSYVQSYVPSLNKHVTSQIHHKSMVQMEWHDGSLKNVHVDPVILFNYQNHLRSALTVYQKRVEWLQGASRKYYGNIVEKRVVFIIDLSINTQYGLGELHLSLKQLFEDQLTNDMTFNMICIGKSLMFFNEGGLLKATMENVGACWRWFSKLSCGGTRKCLPALSHVCQTYIMEQNGLDGIYLIASGTPNEPLHVLNGYAKEALHGTDVSLNCILFGSVTRLDCLEHYEDIDQVASYLREISHQNNGRFHWIDNQVIVESDDVRLIEEEMSHANNYLNKAVMLFEKLRQKAANSKKEEPVIRPSTANTSSTNRKKRILSPKHTALSSTRLSLVRPSSCRQIKAQPVTNDNNNDKQKKSPWRPSTAHPIVSATPSSENGDTKKVNPKSKRNEATTDAHHIFYTEVGNNIGMVRLPRKSPQSSPPSTISLPDNEEILSSKAWLRKYGLNNLNLLFEKVVSTGKCNHDRVPGLNKSIDARHCIVFPKVELKGVTYHVYSRLKELMTYELNVGKALRRYIKRLEWVLNDSHRVFGVLTEQNIVLVIDLSGSMVQHKANFDQQFTEMVWKQLYNTGKRFNVIVFSTDVTCWKNELMDTSKQNCKELIDWFYSLKCHGTTATMRALQTALSFEEVEAVYLLSDGKPDCSKSHVLRQIANTNMLTKKKIHSIAYHCANSEDSAFLKLLASQTKGRFQIFDGHKDIEEIINTKLIQSNLPVSNTNESDDIRILLNEISNAKQYLQNCKTCLSSVENWQDGQNDTKNE